MEGKEKKVCCICGREYNGVGYNAWPLDIEGGECCEKCEEMVNNSRLRFLYSF